MKPYTSFMRELDIDYIDLLNDIQESDLMLKYKTILIDFTINDMTYKVRKYHAEKLMGTRK